MLLSSALLLFLTQIVSITAGPKRESTKSSLSTTSTQSITTSTSSNSSKGNSTSNSTSSFAKTRAATGSLHLTTSPKKPLNDYPDYDPEYVVLNRELGNPDPTLEYERSIKRPIDLLDGHGSRTRTTKRYPSLPYSGPPSISYPMPNYGRPDYNIPSNLYPDEYYGGPVEPPVEYGYHPSASRPYGGYSPYDMMPPGSQLPSQPQYPPHYYGSNYRPPIDSPADRSSGVCNHPSSVLLGLCQPDSGSNYNSYPRGYTNGYGTYGGSNSISPLGYSYAGYIKRQARRYPIMMYTLVQCIPCQRAKHLLAVSYSDVAAHFLELVGDEEWQRQLQADLQQMTGQITFPYIFICGQHIGGSSDLFSLHQSGQLRTMLNNCVPRKQAAQKTY